MKYKTVSYKGLKVYYTPVLDGGGDDFGQEFIRVVEERVGKADHIFEFCAGPGFIGFSLLAHGLCNKLTLADINPAAIAACKETIAKNGLEDRVNVYLSDCLEDIPESEKWDLIVGNPPMIFSSKEQHRRHVAENNISHLRRFDPEFIVHKKFYRDMHKFLKPGGTCLMQESGRYTKPDDFLPIIKENGLEVIGIFEARPLSFFECIFKTRFRANVRRFFRGKNWSDKNPFRKMKPSTIYYMWTRIPQR